MPDIFSAMLKDTTAEHKTHLFDVKCKICTGNLLFMYVVYLIVDTFALHFYVFDWNCNGK